MLDQDPETSYDAAHYKEKLNFSIALTSFSGTNLTTCVFQLVQHSQGLIGQYKPKCTLDGQYEPIQCQGSECWCVDGIGNEILGTFSKLPDIPDCGGNYYFLRSEEQADQCLCFSLVSISGFKMLS